MHQTPTTIKDLMAMLSNRYFTKSSEVLDQQARRPLQQFQNRQAAFSKSKLFKLSKQIQKNNKNEQQFNQKLQGDQNYCKNYDTSTQKGKYNKNYQTYQHDKNVRNIQNNQNNQMEAKLEQIYRQMNFYKQKSQMFQNQNYQLKQKIQTYQKNFAQEKQLVQNLRSMVSSRQKQIDLVFQKEKQFVKKQKQHSETRRQNEFLKKQLMDVRLLLNQQENIIIQLYSNQKQEGARRGETKQQRNNKAHSLYQHEQQYQEYQNTF